MATDMCVFFLFFRSLGESVTPGPMHGLFFFPSFLFIIALVIKRNKLSLEARKQTRASESLKMRSNVNYTSEAGARGSGNVIPP